MNESALRRKAREAFVCLPEPRPLGYESASAAVRWGDSKMFNDKEREAFKCIGAIESYKLLDEYMFYLSDDICSVRLGIKIYEMDHGRFHSVQSHYLHTPMQAGPYHTSRSMQDTAFEALANGIECMTCFIEGAIREGHTPSDDWFVPNPSF